MAEKFNANIQRKEDIERAIEIISNCISMFGPLKVDKENLVNIVKHIADLESDMDAMGKSIEQYESSEAKSVIDSGCATLRRTWEELLPRRNALTNKVEELEENINEYLLYSQSFRYVDDRLLNWLLAKATKDGMTKEEFFAILIVIRNCYNGDNYNEIMKNYSYAVQDQYIVEHLMEFDVEKLCNYIACIKFN